MSLSPFPNGKVPHAVINSLTQIGCSVDVQGAVLVVVDADGEEWNIHLHRLDPQLLGHIPVETSAFVAISERMADAMEAYSPPIGGQSDR